MIKIGTPQISTHEKSSKLSCNINFQNKNYNIWFEVPNEYASYLTIDNCNPFLIGILRYAIETNNDIYCEYPVSEELYYQITTTLIDILCKPQSLRKIQIYAPLRLDNRNNSYGNAVGTGISCGIDSFHVLANLQNTPCENYKITHLQFTNVGAPSDDETYQIRYQRALKFCNEFGFNLVSINTNWFDLIKIPHIHTHTLTTISTVFALEKLYSTYYYASAGEFNSSTINLKNPNIAEYDQIVLSCLSLRNLMLYSEGYTYTRFEKTKDIVNYYPSYKYLNVCFFEGKNCGHCSKCLRTLFALDILGKLELYKDVFDIQDFKKNKKEYLILLYKYYLYKDFYFMELYRALPYKLDNAIKIKAYWAFFKSQLAYKIGLNSPIKKILSKICKIVKL